MFFPHGLEGDGFLPEAPGFLPNARFRLRQFSPGFDPTDMSQTVHSHVVIKDRVSRLTTTTYKVRSFTFFEVDFENSVCLPLYRQQFFVR